MAEATVENATAITQTQMNGSKMPTPELSPSTNEISTICATVFLFIIGGMLLAYMLSSPMAVKPLWISKVNTVAQIVLISFVLGDSSGVGIFEPFIWVCIIAVAFSTVASATAYLVEWVQHMAGGPGHHVSGSDG